MADASQTELLIGGELLAGTGEPVAVENPYTTETIATDASAVPDPQRAEVAAQLDPARGAPAR